MHRRDSDFIIFRRKSRFNCDEEILIDRRLVELANLNGWRRIDAFVLHAEASTAISSHHLPPSERAEAINLALLKCFDLLTVSPHPHRTQAHTQFRHANIHQSPRLGTQFCSELKSDLDILHSCTRRERTESKEIDIPVVVVIVCDFN